MKKKTQSEDKLRGGYYTPPEMANFLAEWGLSGLNDDARILEPSMGDGSIVLSLIQVLAKKGFSKQQISEKIVGVELFKAEIEKAKLKIRKQGIVSNGGRFLDGDFFEAINTRLLGEKFDLIIGNPPFIRYQNFPEEQRVKALDILQKNNFHPNKLTNSWLFFLLVSILNLKNNGKLAMVIPAELLQVGYAAETRLFLSEHFKSITVVTFKKLTFEGIQQEVVLLLCDNGKSGHKGISFVELSDMSELSHFKEKQRNSSYKPIDHNNDKWTQYFLEEDEIMLLRKLEESKKVVRVGDILEVDVGIVTGNNNFFVVNKDIVSKFNLEKFVIPLVGRSAQFSPGLNFSKNLWSELAKDGGLCYLFSHDGNARAMTKSVRQYLSIGVEEGVPDGYKCRIRKCWHNVPSVWVPDAFLFRQVYEFPRIVLNGARAVSTDTVHRVRFNKGVDKRKVAASFHNSLTFAFAEVFGRSYGGGVLELEPSEAENLVVPNPANYEIDFAELDSLIKKDGEAKALAYVDEEVLHKSLGISRADIVTLNKIWLKLSSRRLKRK